MSKRSPRRPVSSADSSATDPPQRGERLQKVLAAAGAGSRRQCEELIVTGRVDVDRQVVTELGTRVDPSRQEIRVDGVRVNVGHRLYFMVNKPVGLLSTNRDPSGRPRVVDMIPSDQRVFTVGRLDKSSEGLIVVTNDGELANRLAHPRYEVEKVYVVEVAGHPTPQTLAQLQRGVYLAEALAKVAGLTIKKKQPHSTVMEMVLREGRNREIRRVLARVGHKVLRLKRIALGPLRLADLPTGACRPLTHEEVRLLRREATGKASPKKEKSRRKKSPPPVATGPVVGTRRRPAPLRSATRGTIIGGEQPVSLPVPNWEAELTRESDGPRDEYRPSQPKPSARKPQRGQRGGQTASAGPRKKKGLAKGKSFLAGKRGKGSRKGRR